MSNLAAFLTARLDEDQAAAADVHDVSADGYTTPETSHDCICEIPASRATRQARATTSRPRPAARRR